MISLVGMVSHSMLMQMTANFISCYAEKFKENAGRSGRDTRFVRAFAFDMHMGQKMSKAFKSNFMRKISRENARRLDAPDTTSTGRALVGGCPRLRAADVGRHLVTSTLHFALTALSWL